MLPINVSVKSTSKTKLTHSGSNAITQAVVVSLSTAWGSFTDWLSPPSLAESSASSVFSEM